MAGAGSSGRPALFAPAQKGLLLCVAVWLLTACIRDEGLRTVAQGRQPAQAVFEVSSDRFAATALVD